MNFNSEPAPMRTIRYLLLFLLASVAASGQTEVSDSHMPWNTYESVTRIDSAYNTIVNNGGIRVPSSATAPLGSTMFSIPLPFDFWFMGDPYPTNSTIGAAITGVLAFEPQPAAPFGGYQLGHSFDGPYTRLLMPFWGNLSAASANGGIYYKVEPDPNPQAAEFNKKILTIEWVVDALNPDGTESARDGRFQVKLYQHRSVIEFRYHTANSLFWQPPTSADLTPRGAAVGIKNFGQPYQFALVPQCLDPDSDDCYTLWITHPGLLQSPVSATRVWVEDMNLSTLVCTVNSSTTLLANGGTAPSNFFHYSFPTTGGATGYRIKPVESEVGPDTLVFSPGRACNLFDSGDRIGVKIGVRNNGTDTARNVPVVFRLHRDSIGGALLLDDTVTVPLIEPHSSVQVAMNDSIVMDTMTSPHMVAEAITNLAGDPDRRNDTLRMDVYKRRALDAKTYCILSPPLRTKRPLLRYAVGAAVPLKGVFLNAGTGALPVLTARCEIRPANGDPIWPAPALYRANVRPLDTVHIEFQNWIPARAGLYYVDMFTAVPGDESPFNDSLLSYPINFGVRRNAKRPTPIPVLVVPAIDLCIGDTVGGFTLPVGKVMRSASAPVMTLLRNVGATDATGVIVTATIQPPDTTPAWTGTDTIAEVVAGGWAPVSFETYVPPTVGTYTVTAVVQYSGDTNRTNDTARWEFVVPGGAAVRPANDAAGVSLTLRPNPAGDRVAVEFAGAVPASVRLYDPAGREVAVARRRIAAGILELETAGLPAGVYTVAASAAGHVVAQRLVIVR